MDPRGPPANGSPWDGRRRVRPGRPRAGARRGRCDPRVRDVLRHPRGDGPMRLETLAVHAGRRVDPTTGAVTPAIHPSTTFEREPDGSYPRGFLYARNANPNRNALEECLAALEGGEAAAAFASASAATSAVVLALQPGDHVVAPTDAYHGTSRLLRETFSRWGLEEIGRAHV